MPEAGSLCSNGSWPTCTIVTDEKGVLVHPSFTLSWPVSELWQVQSFLRGLWKRERDFCVGIVSFGAGKSSWSGEESQALEESCVVYGLHLPVSWCIQTRFALSLSLLQQILLLCLPGHVLLHVSPLVSSSSNSSFFLTSWIFLGILLLWDFNFWLNLKEQVIHDLGKARLCPSRECI